MHMPAPLRVTRRDKQCMRYEVSLCDTSPISSLQVFGFFHFRFGVLNV